MNTILYWLFYMINDNHGGKLQKWKKWNKMYVVILRKSEYTGIKRISELESMQLCVSISEES